jgi:hypoxanthine phosphoribosyltransferase/bifunctional protein TilS/HprT
MHEDIERILVSKEEIDAITKRLGKELSDVYRGKYPIVVGLLKGCVPFMGKLITEMDIHVELGFMDVSSYHGGIESSGDIKIKKDLDVPVQGRDVIIAEDIVDTGRTIRVVMDLLLYRGAKSVSVVTLLDKPEGRVVTLDPEYIGVTIPKEFVVGYGLDYDEKYRNLPYVGILKPEVYRNQ